MGLYDDTVAKILKIVTRPDARYYAELGLNEAILFLHRSEKYPRDLQEQFLISDETLHEIKFALPADVRFVEYLRATVKDNSDKGYTIGNYITMIEPQAVYGINGAGLTDFWYMSANSLNVRSSILTNTFLFGYYKNPSLLKEELDKDWIMTGWNDLVIMIAVANTFRFLRNWAAANSYNTLAAPMIAIFKDSEKLTGDFQPSKDDWGGQG